MGGKDTGTSTAFELSAPGTFPITSEKVTLSFFAVQDPRVENIETTNWYTQYLEDKTNVHIEWELVPQAGVNEKRQLMLASGDYPDVLYGVSVTKEELSKHGAQGDFIAIGDLIDKHCVELKKIFAKYPGTKEAITAPDGNIYAMPYINQCYHCSMSQKMWINRFWLENLGLDMPTTTEEFYQVLKAFKEKDPNRNGKQDEIPLSGSINNWNALPYDFLMNAFIYNDGSIRLTLKNGKYDFAANKAEWREGLRYVRRLYKDGLLDPASFTQDQAQLQRLGMNPEVILGATGGGYSGSLIIRNDPAQRERLYTFVPPLKGPAGNRTTAYYPQDPAVSNFTVTKACQNPEVAIKWADLRYTYEEGTNLNYGERGVNWDWAEAGEVGLNGKPAVWKQLTPLVNPQSVTWYMWGIFNYDADWRFGLSVEKDADPYDPKNVELLLYLATSEHEKYKPKESPPNIWMTKDVSQEVAQLRTQISEYVSESAAQFIVGNKDIETGWEAYVKEFETLGLKRLLEIYQSEFDRQYK